MAQTFKKNLRAIFVLSVLVLSTLFVQSTVSGTTFSEDKIVIWVFDVGQGDAIFIDAPDKQVLIDGGRDGKVLEKLAAVMPPWDREIDVLINSHPHADHVAGLTYVLERYEVGEVWDSGQEYGTDVFEYYKELSDDIDRDTKSEEYIDLGLGATLKIIWPELDVSDQRLSHVHEANVVALFEFGEANMLITGDIEIEEEAKFMYNLEHIDVLKVAHHGSLTSTSVDLLERITPDYAVIPVGADNDYGHPHPVIMDRLKRIGAFILRSDLDGDVRIMMNGGEPEIELFEL